MHLKSRSEPAGYFFTLRPFHYFINGKIHTFWIFPVKQGDGNPDFVGNFNRLPDHYTSC
jgi:hypothetical protein